jgi:hypothetical protein
MSKRYEAFIAFDDVKPPDSPTPIRPLAIDIEKMLAGRGIKIMSAQLSRKKPDQKAIDIALAYASVLVVVANSPTQLESEWVKYAWTCFIDGESSGFKPKGMVFLYIDGFDPDELPAPLRQCQTFIHGQKSLSSLFNAVAKALGPNEENFLDVARELYEAMSNISEEIYCAGWMYSWEYPMWGQAFNRPFEGMQTRMAINDNVPVSAINRVMELSMKCQGWIIWDNNNGPTWIPIDDWLWHLEDVDNRSLEGKGISLR